MFFLILDRFLDMDMDWEYAVYFTKSRVISILFGIWSVCGLFGFYLGIMADKKGLEHVDRIQNFVSLVLDLIIMLTIIRTSIFYCGYKSAAKEIEIENKRNARIKSQKDESKSAQAVVIKGNPPVKAKIEEVKFRFFIPGLMTLSYMAFNILATLTSQRTYMSRGIREAEQETIAQASKLMILLGYGGHALLYIFLQERVRKILTSPFRKKSSG